MSIYHDLSLVSVEFSADRRELIMQGNGLQTKASLIFRNVATWALSPFETQNVIFDVVRYDAATGSKELFEDYDVPDYHREMVLREQFFLFELQASVGMGGYIIAKELIVQQHT
ncbi:hypothetical protein [Dyadobacter crusticola]|uniref:hypothetical protein n=1 Tax=Dyadobacter crusticola TaxID=292407 RepID=UPI0004E15A04|nr:hypothetical protein [Dyadobacter crusticola]